MESEVENKVKEIFVKIIKLDGAFSLSLSRNDLEHWDSLSHIELLVELEKTFNIKFDINSASEIHNIEQIIKVITEKMS